MSGLLSWMEGWLPEAPEGWSDMHLRAGAPPVIKTGDMRLFTLTDGPLIQVSDLESVLEAKVDWTLPVDEDHGITIGDTRFRVNGYAASSGDGIVLRRLGGAPPRLESLNLPVPVLRRQLDRTQGLIIVAGETGSGKTTTLAAMMADRARRFSSTTITIEDPVEIVHPPSLELEDGSTSVFIQREVGQDTASFASGLRAALREAPNVIAVGEIRDQQSARLALQGAETGHLVFATLHTRSAAETVQRLLAFYTQEEHPMVRSQLSSCLAMVMRQVLMPAKDTQGRIPAYEIMTLDAGVPATIRKGKDEQLFNEIRGGGAFGMVTLNDMLAKLVKEGHLSKEEALRHSYDADDLAGVL